MMGWMGHGINAPKFSNTNGRGHPMPQVTTIGLDLAKRVFREMLWGRAARENAVARYGGLTGAPPTPAAPLARHLIIAL